VKVEHSGNFHHFSISKVYKRYHRDEHKGDGDQLFIQNKNKNLGCPPSSHVINKRDIQRFLTYGRWHAYIQVFRDE
jgi:hypothetical protein